MIGLPPQTRVKGVGRKQQQQQFYYYNTNMDKKKRDNCLLFFFCRIRRFDDCPEVVVTLEDRSPASSIVFTETDMYMYMNGYLLYFM